MNELSVSRRLCLACIGIGLSAWVLRPQLADALVLRGDACLYGAQPFSALRYYRRAAWIDPSDGVAVDRFAFVAMTTHEPAALREGIGLASSYLRRRGDDDVVRMDRAMAYRALRDPGRALEDFAAVGRRTRDVRALTFAGYAAAAVGQSVRARALWRSALALAPGFPAALHALTRLRTAR